MASTQPQIWLRQLLLRALRLVDSCDVCSFLSITKIVASVITCVENRRGIEHRHVWLMLIMPLARPKEA